MDTRINLALEILRDLGRHKFQVILALAIIGSARSWHVLPRSVVGRSPLKDFAGRIRLTLDTTRLPKPFQLNIIKSNDWALDSDWIPLTSGQGEGDD